MKIDKSLTDHRQKIHEIMVFICDHMLETRPEAEVEYRPYTKLPFVTRHLRGNIHIRLNEAYDNVEHGDYAYVSVSVKSQCDSPVSLAVRGADSFCVNGVCREVKADMPTIMDGRFFQAIIDLKQGHNELVFKCTAAEEGFELDYLIAHVCFPTFWTCDYLLWVRDTIPTREHYDEQGFALSELVRRGRQKKAGDCRIIFPKPSKADEKIDFNLLYQGEKGRYAAAFSCVKKDGILNIASGGGLVLYVNGEKRNGDFHVKKGDGLFIVCEKNGAGWGFECFSNDMVHLPFVTTKRKDGIHWLLIGAFETADPRPFDLKEPYVNADGEAAYWRFAEPNTYLRPYLDTSFFGQWFYGLMVGEYGILRACEYESRYYDYFDKSMRILVDYYQYMQYDAGIFNDTPFLKRGVKTDDLDSIGTIGMNLYELYQREKTESVKARILFVLNRLLESLYEKVPRMEDGTFFRVQTLWADDTYMSCPFLVRMGNMTGDTKYYDETVRQLKQYAEKLWIKEHNVFSHIYFPDENRANGVPWGRGNGWVYLSFAEVIERLPESYPGRDDLIALFKKAVRGLVALQDENGLWHQVLTMPESYCETSCTALFSVAISKGIKFGALERDRYFPVVKRAVEGMIAYAVDECGNVLGVCRGSSCSDSAEYYANLETVRNDDHGTGILIAALCEMLDLRPLE